jgi:hypothetical protein
MRTQFGTGTPEGISAYEAIIQEVRAAGRGRRYDCVVGVSGGVDSSYMLHHVMELGLRPLAVHFDNTWNTAIATENIRKMTRKLNIDLYTHVVNNREMDDIFLAFLKAGVPELDAATDLGFAETHYRAASAHGIRYVFEGHSFLEEGISPLGSMYFDGKYIEGIHRRFGSLPLNTYPLMDFKAFMKWTLVKRIRKIRPYWFIPYRKGEARELLTEQYGWQDYGGHHLENRMSAFMHSCYLPQKFRMDQRNNTLSALARNGAMSREDALRAYAEPPYIEPELVGFFKKRLGLDGDTYDRLMSAPPHWYQEFETYKRRFERLSPLFYLLARAQLVPMSFYLKYCTRDQA